MLFFLCRQALWRRKTAWHWGPPRQRPRWNLKSRSQRPGAAENISNQSKPLLLLQSTLGKRISLNSLPKRGESPTCCIMESGSIKYIISIIDINNIKVDYQL
jgi:hypothetical protein